MIPTQLSERLTFGHRQERGEGERGPRVPPAAAQHQPEEPAVPQHTCSGMEGDQRIQVCSLPSWGPHTTREKNTADEQEIRGGCALCMTLGT